MGNVAVIQSLSDLAAWYRRPFGDRLRLQLTAYVNDTLNQLAVHEALCLGVEGFQEFFSGGQHRWATFFSNLDCTDWLAGEDHCLPLKPESQECVVILHGLDVASNPHVLLRELNRVISNDGYLMIVGFNPASLMGVYRPLGRLLHRRGGMPWALRFYGLGRLRDWLSLLSFEVHAVQTAGMLPYAAEAGSQTFHRLAERTGSLLLPNCGSAYVVLARKRTIPLTPIKMKWKTATAPLLKAGFPNTTAGRSR